MNYNIPYLFEAKQVTVMSVNGLAPQANGTVATTTSMDLADLGVFDRFIFNGNRGLFEYSPANAPIENYQDGKSTFTATISQFDAPGKASVLLDIYSSFSYVRVEGVAQNDMIGLTGKRFVVVAKIDNIETGWVEQKNATSLVLRPCGILPQWAAAPTI